jgi:hypothetical protein
MPIPIRRHGAQNPFSYIYEEICYGTLQTGSCNFTLGTGKTQSSVGRTRMRQGTAQFGGQALKQREVLALTIYY